MKNKKMTFEKFYKECNNLYNMYEPHFFLQGCEIFTNFEGNEIDNGCWYCVVKIRDHVHTVLAYDHTGDSDDDAFVVNCDWSLQGCANELGYYAECKDFDNLEEAFYFMVQEPSRYYQNCTNFVTIEDKNVPEEIYGRRDGCALIKGIEFIKEHEDWFTGKTMQIKLADNTVLYQRKIN